jgi:hypothetical protein
MVGTQGMSKKGTRKEEEGRGKTKKFKEGRDMVIKGRGRTRKVMKDEVGRRRKREDNRE